ncbi:hypothetical protein PSAC2689_100012 [Paraburkholderia sacchari]
MIYGSAGSVLPTQLTSPAPWCYLEIQRVSKLTPRRRLEAQHCNTGRPTGQSVGTTDTAHVARAVVLSGGSARQQY